jgi:hypothetical protein
MPIGERIHTTPRYIKHPPAGTFWWADGYSVDAGTAHIIHSNLAHLCETNLRPLGCMLGPGGFRGLDLGKTSNAYTAAEIIDAAYPEDPADPLLAVLRAAWLVGHDAMCIGPVPAAAVAIQVDPPGYTPRTIKTRVTGRKGLPLTDFYMVTALTQGPAPPSVNIPLVYSISPTYAGTGSAYAIDWDTVLVCPGPVRPSREMPCRAADGNTESTVVFPDLYVWLAWVSDNATNTATSQDAVYTFEAWEVT